MRPERSPEPDCSCPTATAPEEDTQVQQAVLAVVFDQHPTVLSSAEIVREIGGGEDERVERAIRDLASAGLLRREGDSILLTRAALHFDSQSW
jgi:hypothetical protein